MRLRLRALNSPKIDTVGQYLFVIEKLFGIRSYGSVRQVGMDAFVHPIAEAEFHQNPNLLLQLHSYFLNLAGKCKGY